MPGEGSVFGRALAYTWVIEFQKRGLPHAHILLILHSSFLIRSAADVDGCCRAEIPDPTAEPELYRLVSDNMLHGPCSADTTPLPPCRQANPQECRFGFPKSFVDESSLDDDSYATYRRRDNGATITKRRSTVSPLFTYTNRDVVPYNPFLLLRYRCHCNVEICSSIKAYKYIFKYIYKGPDKATAELSAASSADGAAVDEIRQYVDSRYFSATEALWRFYRFSVDGRYPAVVRLALHEQGLQPVLFQAVGSLAQAASDARVRAAAETTLTGFFSFNASVKARLAAGEPVNDGERRATFDTLYQDWPEALRLGSGKPAIGRMYACSPAAGERFYLRILLLHVPGFSSFDDAKTVDGRRYDTFKQACVARVLISDDRDMDLALDEAAYFASGYQQRLLFVYIAVYGETADLEGLWLRHREALTDDCLHILHKHYGIRNPTEQQRFDYGLQTIRQEIQRLKGSLDGVGLPRPSRLIAGVRGVEGVETWDSLMESINDGHTSLEQALEMRERMTASQQRAYDVITAAVDVDRRPPGAPKIFFLYGSGGTGKTFLQNVVRAEIVASANGDGSAVACVASTGIAATLLSGGLTAHKFFKIPLEVDELSYSALRRSTDPYPPSSGYSIGLCFAMTINKSQGQSFDRVGIMLDPPIFSHGQLYVALSRVTAPDGVRIVPDEEGALTGRVSNVVWPEVFQSVRVGAID
ncbi:putative helicase-like protein [Neofusicoccum parvum UCRNP2]|uniref:ATP-dependent DNA helicase n=1 Tax=Botryosphaeria parva (strain UCR-NP2) TaxID=1287680 RepID=R1GU55_BOTPV|nr:putative helicase-like protein [Neofusicoccum parvum UCRNP2]